jgi:flagellar hook-basal body complex protein FliE
MDTQPFSKIQPIQSAAEAFGTPKKGGTTSGVFADIFSTAIGNVQETAQDMSEKQYLLATGQLDNPAEVTIAATKATAAVELLIQLRNKAQEAYGEVMRIGI